MIALAEVANRWMGNSDERAVMSDAAAFNIPRREAQIKATRESYSTAGSPRRGQPLVPWVLAEIGFLDPKRCQAFATIQFYSLLFCSQHFQKSAWHCFPLFSIPETGWSLAVMGRCILPLG